MKVVHKSTFQTRFLFLTVTKANYNESYDWSTFHLSTNQRDASYSPKWRIEMVDYRVGAFSRTVKRKGTGLETPNYGSTCKGSFTFFFLKIAQLFSITSI